MIDDLKSHITTALQSAGFNARKIVNVEDDSFDSPRDIRPVCAVYGIKIQNWSNKSMLGKVTDMTVRVMIMVCENSQQSAINKILNIHDELHGSHVTFTDSRISMEGVFGIAETPQALEINRKEATYSVEYDAPLTVRLA